MASAAVHSVHIYNEHSDLISRLCGIVSSSLRVGDSVLIVATSDHRARLVAELESAGIDVRLQAREGRFTMVDASEMLSAFMRQSLPDRELFLRSAGELLHQASSASKSCSQGLTVFGEMVAVLWEQGNKEAALQLEELWNDVLSDRSFHLHCAYPRDGFMDDDEATVCSLHSHMLAA